MRVNDFFLAAVESGDSYLRSNHKKAKFNLKTETHQIDERSSRVSILSHRKHKITTREI